jgi:phosphoglycolate phosphatase
VSSLLALWDVDFTLVNTRGVGIHLYQLAFRDLYGRELPDASAKANMAGRTDLAIALDVLELAGVPDPPGQAKLFEKALTRLAPQVKDLVLTSGQALPGAGEALEALAKRSVTQSLLTGNVRAMAEVKLAPFGLTKHLDLEIGAYGDESTVRADLVHLARARAATNYWKSYSGPATILIGDTPLDIEAARATGAWAVGVATGRYSTDELTSAGADVVLPDLADTDRVLDAVLGTGPRLYLADYDYQPRPA